MKKNEKETSDSRAFQYALLTITIRDAMALFNSAQHCARDIPQQKAFDFGEKLGHPYEHKVVRKIIEGVAKELLGTEITDKTELPCICKIGSILSSAFRRPFHVGCKEKKWTIGKAICHFSTQLLFP